jgi:hypothetical protein
MLRLAVSISRPGCYELQSDCPHELLLAHLEGREVLEFQLDGARNASRTSKRPLTQRMQGGLWRGQGGHGRRALPQFTLVPSTPC